MLDMFIFSFLLLVPTVLALDSAPRLKIEQGFLSGQYLQTVNGRPFSSFTAIPYAEPPVGHLRFEPPQLARGWQGVRNATMSHPICPQTNIFANNFNVTGDEDCLYLNVYTPQLTCCDIKDLPVMIFFHGGLFFLEDGNLDTYPPHILLDKDVVLVVPNYRLGPLGFLSTGDLVVPGNNGFKDQNLAIQWVKRNILQFGGDPDSITVFGQSAGGSSAHYHMLSPLSKDLIKGVISQSGTAFSIWALPSNTRTQNNFVKLAQSLNCFGETRQVIECLKYADASDLIRAQDTLYLWGGHPTTPFRPVIEPDHEGAFLTDHPANIIKSGRAAKIPFMTGITSEDGAVIAAAILGNAQMLEEYRKNLREILPATLPIDESTSHKETITDKIIEYYLSDKTVTNSSIDEITKLYTDGRFLVPLNEALKLHSKYTQQPVYNYVFGYRTSVSYSSFYGDRFNNYGVTHSDDLIHFFPRTKLFPNYVPSDSDRIVSEIMTTMWTNFAATGNPTPVSHPLLPEKWEEVGSEKLEYLSIRGPFDVRMSKNLYSDRRKFWENLPLHAYCKEIQF